MRLCGSHWIETGDPLCSQCDGECMIDAAMAPEATETAQGDAQMDLLGDCMG